MELEGKDQMLLCAYVLCFYYPFHQQSLAVRSKTLSFILNEREEKMMEKLSMCSGAATSDGVSVISVETDADTCGCLL